MKIGIVGLGTVGFGVVEILTQQKERLEKTINQEVTIKYGCALEDVDLPEGIIYTKDFHDVINDEEVDVVVELIGGTTIAKTIILEALNNGKHVVTANKALLAHHGQEIFETAAKNNVKIYYEASVGGGIPVVVPAKEDLVANEINKIEGILNGTTNFILTLMETDNLDFDEALTIADGLGFVEADASLDLDGIDAAHKIYILAMNAFEIFFDFNKIHATGIRSVTKKDMDYAKKLGYRIKLIAQAKKLDNGYGIDVSPTLVGIKDIVASVNQAYNVVEITCNYLENVIFYGKGAGRYVTASAVVSDIIKTSKPEIWKHEYRYENNIFPITKSKYYVRCDHPLDLDYETYFSFDKDHIYITNTMELDDLKNQLEGETYNLFKVRD
ncbi:MAG: homoserine dehydrogenase [Erysipelotrichaceae bacterium]|nr:homoserine dehydrogenase [Erysipelotrichaceae bacterium]